MSTNSARRAARKVLEQVEWHRPGRDLVGRLGRARWIRPGYRRPVLIAQCDALNRSRVGTVVCVPLTSTLKWADAPGNVLLSESSTGLPKDSVAKTSPIVASDKRQLTECVGTAAAPTGSGAERDRRGARAIVSCPTTAAPPASSAF